MRVQEGRDASFDEDSPFSDNDPTGTSSIRNELINKFTNHWIRVQKDITETIVDNNALEQTSRKVRWGSNPRGFGSRSTDSRRPISFDATDNAELLESVSDWLHSLLEHHVLKPVSKQARRKGKHYTGDFIRRAYLRGYMRAGVELRKERMGVSDRSPHEILSDQAHSRRLRRLQFETYHDVDVFVQATHANLVREVSNQIDGIDNPSELSEALNDRIDAVGITRATATTHCRAVLAANYAALRRYERAGYDTVYVTTRDHHPSCTDCTSLANRPLEVSKIYNRDAPFPVLDTHPECVCFVTVSPSQIPAYSGS